MLHIQYFYALYLSLVDAVVLSILKAKSLGILSGGWIFPLAFMAYGSQSLIFYNSLSVESLTIMNIMWDVMSDVIVTAIGIFVFKESLNTTQSIGILLSIIGIAMLGYK